MWTGGLAAEGSFDCFLCCLGFLALAYERVGGILFCRSGHLAAVGLFYGVNLRERGFFGRGEGRRGVFTERNLAVWRRGVWMGIEIEIGMGGARLIVVCIY